MPVMPAATLSASFEKTSVTVGEPLEGRAPSMRWVVIGLLVALAWLQYRLWVGEGSLAEVHNLKEEIARQGAELEQLRVRNRALMAEVQNLKAGQEALEERARAELGMVKEGETFYQLIGPAAAPAPAR